MTLSGIRRDVFMDRYARKDNDGKAVETSPEEMWDRVAAAIAEVEAPKERPEWTARFRRALDGFKFVPGGRILAGAGTGQKVTFYNCLPPQQPVLTSEGYQPIAEIDARALVVTGQGRARMVTQVFAREAEEPLYEVRMAGADGLLRLTGNHPVLARRGGGAAAWVRAGELSEGDLVGCLAPEPRRAGDAQAWHVRREEPVGWSPRGAAQVLVRERRETYVGVAWRAVVTVVPRPYHGTVYDLEVEEDHSFVTAGAIVSNCYVIPSPEDSRRGIMDSVGLMVEIMSRGGGVGVNLSSLRPRGSYVRGVNGTASGPVSWGEVYSTATGAVIQGGCFGAGTRIATDRGLVPAAELADRLERGQRIRALTHDGPREIAWAFRNGVKPLLRVTTARGFQVEVTPDHRMGVLRDGALQTEPMRNLAVGDAVLTFLGHGVQGREVALARPAPERPVMGATPNAELSPPDRLGSDLAYLIGYLHGEGGLHHARTATRTAPEAARTATAEDRPEIRERLVELAGRLFGARAAPEPGAGSLRSIGLDARLPVHWLEANGLLSTSAGGRRVPEAVMRSPAPVQGAFLAGYFDADGCDRGRRGGYGIDSVSLGMLRDLQTILAANGILSRIATDARGEQGWRATHRLIVAGAAFRARIQRFAAMSLKMRERPTRRRRGNGYPHARSRPLGVSAPACQGELGLWDGGRRRTWFHAQSRVRDRPIAAGRTAMAMATTLQRARSYVPDRIVSVEFLGMQDVYDFEVTETHMLSGSGLYTSNSRRGALMLMLDDEHPDVEEFVTVKKDLTRINNANLSICVSDRFMEAVKNDADWDLRWADKPYKTIRARELWNLICESAWASGEPGVVFMERYQKWSNTWYCEDIRCVNPCGEQGLGPWGVCNLGAINIAAFVKNKKFDWNALRETVAVATRFLDNVIDCTEYYFAENEQAQRHGIRRTGLGSMGLADALIRLELRYGSPEAIAFCDRLYALVRDVAYRTSAEIAVAKGPFPAFDRDRYLQGRFIQELPTDVRELIASNGIRNGVLLTQAPTGTTSLLAGVSSGIEPVYAFSFKRVDRTGTHVVYHELYRQWMEQHPDEPAPQHFVSADQLTPEEHVRMQAAIQKYVDASISKTVNAPNAHTVEEVKTLYTLAYDLGCKGVTYFRDGCRTGVLTKLEESKPKAGAKPADDGEVLPLGRRVNGGWGRIRPIERPARLVGFTDRKQTPLGTLFLTLNTLDGHPVELFATIGKAGSDVSAFTEGIARLVSVALRSGVDPTEVASQLKGIGGSRSVGFGPGRVRSVPDAMGQFIEEILQQGRGEGTARPAEGRPHHNGHGRRGAQALKPVAEGTAPDVAAPPGIASAGDVHAPAVAGGEVHPSTFNLCPACGLHTLAYVEGCALCFSCGYSEC